MNFYGGRVSLLPIEGNIFYLPGKEKKLEYFMNAMSERFEIIGKYGVNLINEPWIHKEKGFIGGRIGRKGSTKLPDHDGYHFKKRSELIYPHVHYFFLRSQQTILIEKNTSVFHKPEKVFEYLSNYLNSVLFKEGLSAYIKPLTTKGKFWHVLEEMGEVHEVRFRFVAPNNLGEMYKDMKKLLSDVNKETQATEIEHAVINNAGRITVPHNSSYQSAVGWIEDGGGSWEVTRRAIPGKPRKSVSNKKSITIFERQIRIDNLTMDELWEIAVSFDLGQHKIESDEV